MIFKHFPYRGRQEVNSLLFCHALYRDDLLENVIGATSIVFFCALQGRPKSASTSCLIKPDAENMDVEVQDEKEEEKEKVIVMEDNDDDLMAEEEYDDDDSKSDIDRAILRIKRGKRKALKERRLLAVSSIDGIIDFWKQILFVSGLTPSSSERALQSFVDETHDFDPYAFKRKTITTLMRYLPAMWGHEDISSLPPSTVRNLLDLMQVAIKSLQDSKLFPLQSAVSERDRLRTTIITPSPADAPSGPGPVSTSMVTAAATNARRRDDRDYLFRVSTGTVAILTDMGFRDEDIRRLAVQYRTNSVSALTNHLLELASNPEPETTSIGDTTVTSSSDAVAVAVTVTETSEANSVTSSSNSASSSVPVPVAVADPETSANDALDPLTEEYTVSAMDDASPPISATTATSDSLTSITVIKPLPLISRRPTEELHRDKAILQTITKRVFRMVPLSCLRLIERGLVSAGGEWGIEVSSVNQVT